jgi:hypothetical protein
MDMDSYDDMMGLEFGDYEGFINAEMVKEALISSSAGGGAILLTTWGMTMLSEKLDLATKVPNGYARTALTSGAAFLLAVVGGRAMYDYNREAAMGVVGGLGGFAMATFIDGMIAEARGSERLLGTPLGEADADMDDESLLSAYNDNYDGMSALASLETTGVTSAPGAFADPSVTPEALMGLDGTVVQEETLGAYQPYLA